jgi:hypothetical protein
MPTRRISRETGLTSRPIGRICVPTGKIRVPTGRTCAETTMTQPAGRIGLKTAEAPGLLKAAARTKR